MVDSIQSPRTKPVNITPSDEVPVIIHTSSDHTASSPGQRHRALADALFGSEDPERSFIPSPTTRSIPLRADSLSLNITEEKPPTSTALTPGQDHEPATQTPSAQALLAAVTSPPTISSDHADPTQLELEVQRRIEAATAALRKSPSIPKLDGGGSPRKRISPNQISSPKLVSASTSVDTIPLPAMSPTHQRMLQPPPSTRLGSRFKILRGKSTLRAKTPIGPNEEAHLNPADVKSPLSAQTATYNPDLYGMRDKPTISSATESGRFKISPPPVNSPPASAGPGLRGFMSRFRKQRPGEMISSAEKLGTPSRTPTTASSSISAGSPLDLPRNSNEFQVMSAPAAQSQFAALRPLSPQSPLSPSFAQSIPEDSVPLANAPVPQADEALRQLYNAGKSLGLDEAALHDLVARSPSVTSRTTTWSKLTRNNSVAANHQTQHSDSRDGRPSQSPLLSESRPSIDALSPRPSAEIKQLSVRKHAEPSSSLRGLPQANTDPLRTVVRRTIILPSDSHTSVTDLTNLIRKQTTSQRRRSAGAGSITSNRSLQDRAPTPPPPRSAGGKRFSADRSPPVPHLPQVLVSHANTLLPPAQVEKSNSTYDSL